MQVFEGKAVAETRFAPLIPSAFLDYPNCQLLLFPSRHTIESQLGAGTKKELLDEANREMEEFEAQHTHAKGDEMAMSETGVVGDGKLEKPLTEGKLV